MWKAQDAPPGGTGTADAGCGGSDERRWHRSGTPRPRAKDPKHPPGGETSIGLINPGTGGGPGGVPKGVGDRVSAPSAPRPQAWKRRGGELRGGRGRQPPGGSRLTASRCALVQVCTRPGVYSSRCALGRADEPPAHAPGRRGPGQPDRAAGRLPRPGLRRRSLRRPGRRPGASTAPRAPW